MAREEQGEHAKGRLRRALNAAGERTAAWVGTVKDRLFATLERLGKTHGSVAVIATAVEDFFRHRMVLHAGNFAYSGFLALFPLLLVIFAVVGWLFAYDPDVLKKTVEVIEQVFPGLSHGSAVNVTESLERLRNVAGVLGVIGLLWSVSRISYALDTGFETIWETRKINYFKKKAFAFLVLLLVGLVGLVGLAITFITSQALSWVDERTGPLFSAVTLVLGLLLSPMATFLIFATLYRVIPRKRPRMREVFWGALVAALLLDATEYAFSYYVTSISKQQALYGSVGVLLGIVLWMYIVGIMIFLGAEIVHVLQVRRGLAAGDAGAPGEVSGPAG